MRRAIVLSVLAALSTASYTAAAEGAADTSAPPPAVEAASADQDKKPAPKNVRQKREKRKFQRKLACALDLHRSNRCGAAYPQYLDLQAQQPQHPDVLWGLGVCGALTAQPLELGQDARRQRLLDAKAAYEAYVAAEKRLKFTTGPESRVALARERAEQLGAQIAALPASPATPPPAPPLKDGEGEGVGAPPPAGVPPEAELPPAAAPSPSPAAAAPADAARAEAERDHVEAAEARRQGFVATLGALTAAMRARPDDLALQEKWVLTAVLVMPCVDVMNVYLRIAEQSRNVKVHRAGGVCASETEQSREMFLAFERYVRLSPRYEVSADTFRVIAEIFVRFGERDRAKHYFELFLARLGPTNGDSKQRAAAERYLREFRQALTDCLVKAGVTTAQLVPVSGRWVVQILIPPDALERAPSCKGERRPSGPH